MKKTILTLLLTTTTLSFANVFDDACVDFDKEHAKNKKLTVLEYAEALSARTNQARNANRQDEADRLLKIFTVTVSTGLRFGIDNNPAPDLVKRLEKALDNAYSPLSKTGISPKDLAESFNDMDEIYDIARKKEDTLNQYTAVVHYSYQAVGLDKIKPWHEIPNIDQKIKTTKPSELFIPSIFEKKDEKSKPVLSPSKPSTLLKPEAKPAPVASKPSTKADCKETIFKGETSARKLSLLRFQPEGGFKTYPSKAEEKTYKKYKEDEELFKEGEYPYKHLEEDLEAVKGLQEINIDSLMGDEVITDLITFYQEKPDNDKRLAALRKELAGFDDIIKTKRLAYEYHKPKIEELQQKIKESSEYKEGITYLKESGSSNFNKGVEALLKAINYKGNISEENKFKLGKMILGCKVIKLNIDIHTTPKVNLKKALGNVFQGHIFGKHRNKKELASILFNEGILAVPKINMSTRATSLVVDIGNHFDLKEHGENDVYLEFDDGKIGRLTTGNHFYSSVGLKLSLQEQTALEEIKKNPAGH